MPRKQLAATVQVGHHNFTGFAELATATDVRYLRVEVDGLAWLAHVDLEFDAKTGAVTVKVMPADENAATAPDMVVHPDGRFSVRS